MGQKYGFGHETTLGETVAGPQLRPLVLLYLRVFLELVLLLLLVLGSLDKRLEVDLVPHFEIRADECHQQNEYAYDPHLFLSQILCCRLRFRFSNGNPLLSLFASRR